MEPTSPDNRTAFPAPDPADLVSTAAPSRRSRTARNVAIAAATGALTVVAGYALGTAVAGQADHEGISRELVDRGFVGVGHLDGDHDGDNGIGEDHGDEHRSPAPGGITGALPMPGGWNGQNAPTTGSHGS